MLLLYVVLTEKTNKKKKFLPSQKKIVAYSGSGEEVTIVQLVESPAQVTDRHRRQGEDLLMVPRRRAAALPSEALSFLSCLPRGKWCSSLGKEASGCQESPQA